MGQAHYVRRRTAASGYAKLDASTTTAHPCPPMTRARRTTKDKLMDAAEKLFARRGFHGTSLRDITGAAGVDLALVNYHFGSKKQLLSAVVERRGQVLNEERLERLAQARLRSAPHPPSTESVVDAFLDPILERLADAGPGWHSYFSLLAYVNNSPEWGRRLMGKTFDRTVREFIGAVADSLPSRFDRHLLGLQLPDRRSHAVAGGDRPFGCALRWPVPLRGCRRPQGPPRALCDGGSARPRAALMRRG